MATRRRMNRAQLAKEIKSQRQWIEEHGGDLAGYIARYGDPGHPIDRYAATGGYYGAGGTAIYQADAEVLRALEADFRVRFGACEFETV